MVPQESLHGIAASSEQSVTELQQHEERRSYEKTEAINNMVKRNYNVAAEEDEEQRTEQYSSGGLKGKRTSDKLAAISEEKGESDDEVLEWRVGDVFSGLDNDLSKNRHRN